MKSFNYYLDKIGEVGFVESVTKSTAGVVGLPGACPNEVVLFETGQLGQILSLEPEKAEVLVFSEIPVKSGVRLSRTAEQLAVPVGEELLGQVINPLGQLLSFGGRLRRPKQWRVIKKDSPGIEKRTQVCQNLETGVTVVDLLVPLGCGQRELIIGDRKTGKTSLLLQTVLTQARLGMTCIWTVIGKDKDEVAQIEDFFQKQKVKEKVVIIAASAQEPAGLIYLAPFSAITLAEYFRDNGQNSLVVLDDLTVHAKFYRELALLANRFPGRDSYPADIFFTHAALMEKGGNFKISNNKEVSITILPVAETTEGDLGGYIQTNLMSMTDGHIYFDKSLFSQGRRPAVNPFLSVTRVGRQTQTALFREANRELMAFLTQYQKLESYVHFGAELTDEVKATLKRGERIIHFFDQKSSALVPANLSLFLLACLWQDFWPLDELIERYFQNQIFRQQVEKAITSSPNFASLIKKVQKESLK